MANVISQGEDYIEDDTEELDEDLLDEGDEDTDTNVQTLFGVPIKFLVLGAAAIFVIILITIVVLTRKSNTEVYVADPVYDAPVDGQVTYTQAQTTNVDLYDANNTLIGSSTNPVEGMPVTLAGNTVGFISAAGTVQLHDLNGNFYNYMPNDTTGQSTTSEQPTEALSDDRIVTLRKLGYTGDEIEVALKNGLSYEQLVEDAIALRDAEAKEALVRMSDSASEEFRYIVNYSIFSLPYQEFNYMDTENNIMHYVTDKYIVNADYEKCPTYGYQLFIKLKIANDTYTFMQVDPRRYNTLPESGNIVVQIDYELWGDDEDLGRTFFITNITEKDITQLTVNPQDTTVDLGTIVGLEEAINDDNNTTGN